jgi:chemotaxis protein methyltransferase CheR
MPIPAIISPELTEQDFQQIVDLVKQHCGINIRAGKHEMVKSRLNKRLRALGLRDYGAYIDYLRSKQPQQELAHILDALSTNVTRFFREPDHFSFLAKEYLSEIQSERTGEDRRLRIWSSGCSTGEEPYTIAIVVNETIPAIGKWDVKILATDLSRTVVQAASEGRYSAAQVEGVPKHLLLKYFIKSPQQPGWKPEPGYFVRDELKKKITFARLNLLEKWPMKGPFDVIFCRNVMIYFEKNLRQKLVSRYQDLLCKNGILIVGHSESLTGIAHKLKFVRPTIYRRT